MGVRLIPRLTGGVSDQVLVQFPRSKIQFPNSQRFEWWRNPGMGVKFIRTRASVRYRITGDTVIVITLSLPLTFTLQSPSTFRGYTAGTITDSSFTNWSARDDIKVFEYHHAAVAVIQLRIVIAPEGNNFEISFLPSQTGSVEHSWHTSSIVNTQGVWARSIGFGV